jgi:hypothetical protein
MDPMTASILGVIFVVIGFAALLLMLELQGFSKERINRKALVRFHKIFGYVFTIIFIFMLVGMISRTEGVPTEFSPRIILHIVFALALGVILCLKLLAVRRYKRMVHWIMGFGVIIFILAFLLNAITAGYFFLFSGASPEVRKIQEVNDSLVVKGGELVQKKCTLCHNLDRVKNAEKNEEMWSATIDRMAGYSNKEDFLSVSEKGVVIKFLLMKK